MNPEAPLDDLDDHWHEQPPRTDWWSILSAIGVVVLAGIAIYSCSARAHDHNHPELTEWFKAQHNQNGSPCCDGSDALRISDPDWDTVCDDKGCHYRVMLDGKWWDVPDYAVVTGPNRAQVALVWPIRYGFPDGHADYLIRCFMPGAGT